LDQAAVFSHFANSVETSSHDFFYSEWRLDRPVTSMKKRFFPCLLMHVAMMIMVLSTASCIWLISDDGVAAAPVWVVLAAVTGMPLTVFGIFSVWPDRKY
jgi:hypothetical protein